MNISGVQVLVVKGDLILATSSALHSAAGVWGVYHDMCIGRYNGIWSSEMASIDPG